MCPVKHCQARFTVRSNCLAHGRSKHAKSKNFHPVFIDNALSAGEVETLLLRLDDDGRGPGEGGVAAAAAAVAEEAQQGRAAMDIDRDGTYVPDRKKRGGAGGGAGGYGPADKPGPTDALPSKRKRAESKVGLMPCACVFGCVQASMQTRRHGTNATPMYPHTLTHTHNHTHLQLCAPPILTTEGRLLLNIKEMLTVKESVEVVSSWCNSLYCEVQQVSERYLKLAALLSKDHSTSPFTDSVGHFTQSVGNLEAMCTQTLGFVERDALTKLRGSLNQEQSKSEPMHNAISSAC